jgi:hypothetical protein
MTCFNVAPSAPDTLNQLGGLSDWLSSAVKTVSSGVSTVGTAISNNSGALVNLMNAYGTMQAQKAAAQVAVSAAQQQAKLQAQAASGLTGQQAMNYLSQSPPGITFPSQPSSMPSWVLPVGLGVGALVLVMMLTQKRGGNG